MLLPVQYLPQVIKESESKVAQSCPTLRDPMDCSLPASSVRGIFQARLLEWGAIAFSARLPCPSPIPGACSNPWPLNWWCYPTISSSVIPFSSHLQFFPASGSFLKDQLFASGPKYWSFSFSISPSSEYSRLISFRIDWFDRLAVQGPLKEPSLATQFKSCDVCTYISHCVAGEDTWESPGLLTPLFCLYFLLI